MLGTTPDVIQRFVELVALPHGFTKESVKGIL